MANVQDAAEKLASAAQDGGGGAVGTLAAVLLSEQAATGRFGRHARRLAAAYFIGAAGWEIANKAKRHYRDRDVFTVTVESGDEIYRELQSWLLNLLSPEDRKALSAFTVYDHSDNPKKQKGGFLATLRNDEIRYDIHLRYDGETVQTVPIDGHNVRVQVNRDALNAGAVITVGPNKPKERIIFTAFSVEARDAVVEFLRSIAQERGDRRKPNFWMATKYGEWQNRNDLPQRNLETVVLREGQAEGMVADLQRFFDEEERYLRLGMPWHRGLLLYGPPGTGKTSVVRALATHFGLDLYFITLSDLETDSVLINLVAEINPGSILVLEDIDVLHGATHRDDETNGVTLSGLLNTLDGIATPHGLITVLTTNKREVIDEAVLRPGRCDAEYRIDYLDSDQLIRLFKAFYEAAPGRLPSLVDQKVTPAQVVEIFKRNPDSVQDAVKAVRELVRKPKK